MKIKYLQHKMSAGFMALFCGRCVQTAALGLIGLFLPIFLFEKYGFEIRWVLLYYSLGYFFYFLLLPFGAQFLNKIGLQRALQASVFFDILYYSCFLFFEKNVFLFSALALIFLVINRLLLWVPYHTDFAKFTDRSDRGKEVSLLWGTQAFLRSVMPILAGFLITSFNYQVVFIVAMILFGLAFFPYLSLPKVSERYSWGIAQTFSNFLNPKNRRLILANIANGAENAVGAIIWPIFMWEVLSGNYLEVGALSSLVIVFTIFLQLLSGRYTDSIDKRKLFHWGSAFYALGWVIKAFVLTFWQVFFVSTYHSFTKIFKNTPFDSLNYEIIADKGHYVDEYTVLKEMAISFGRFAMTVFAIILSIYLGTGWIFFFAALSSLFVNLL